jgi:hypothetical protein
MPRVRKKKNADSKGDCYEAAFKMLMDLCLFSPEEAPRYLLVHAEVQGQGPLAGARFGHAFLVRDSATAIDSSNGRSIEMPAFLYYAIGQIQNIGNERQYTWEESQQRAIDHGTYGPWDLVTSTGL